MGNNKACSGYIKHCTAALIISDQSIILVALNYLLTTESKMRLLRSMLTTAVLASGLHAHKCYIPEDFQNGEIIEQLVVICDVDGVVRDSVESKVDQRIVTAVKSLVQRGNVHVTFLSGTPAWNDQTVALWRRGNMALDEAFGSSFRAEQAADQIDILGGFGGQKLHPDGTVEPLEKLSIESVFTIGKIMVCGLLQQIAQQGNHLQQQFAQELLTKAEKLQLQDLSQNPVVTPAEFEDIALEIRQKIDPRFRLLSNICVIEVQMSPYWDLAQMTTWVKDSLQDIGLSTSEEKRQLVSGRAKRSGEDFDFILFGTTNKGTTSAHIIAEKRKCFPRALVVTLGDTQGDFPMHANAHLGFHVGMHKVWEQNQLAQCVMVKSANGQDSQHVEGTLYVLEQLENALGKPFHDLKYLPCCSSAGEWELASLKELNLIAEPQPVSTAQ